jgi:hypothetical protein
MKNLLLLVTTLAFVSFSLSGPVASEISLQGLKNPARPESAQINCPAIGYFLGKPYNGLGQLIPNKTGYCMNLTEICCSVNDLKNIQKWWEGPISPLEQFTESRNTIRKRKLHNVSNYTKEILRRHSTLTEFALSLTTAPSTDAYCKSSAENFLSITLDAQNLLQKFTEESTRCWEFTNELQISLMCSACDHKAQKYLDFPKSEILINPESFRKFSSKCKKMV